VSKFVLRFMRSAFRAEVTAAVSRGGRPALHNQRHTKTLINFYVNYLSGIVARRRASRTAG
jgi:hypothetical protein